MERGNQAQPSGEGDPDEEEQRRRDEADAEIERKRRGLLPEPEVIRLNIQEFLRRKPHESRENETDT